MKRNILLAPTTDHCVKSFYYSYKGLLGSYNISICLDSPNIKQNHKLEGFKKLNKIILSNNNLIKKLNNIFRVRKFTNIYLINISYLIVSNECGLIQSAFVKKAKKKGIEVISHQVSSGIEKKGKKIKLITQLKKYFLSKIYDTNMCRGYGYYSDRVWLMGDVWSKITNNTNTNVVSNGYYYNFKEIYEEFVTETKIEKYNSTNKQKIVFFGAPFIEFGLTTKKQLCDIYTFVSLMGVELGKTYNIFYKPHPQEFTYLDFKFNDNVSIIDDLNSEETISITNIGVSLSSSMSLQMKLLGKRSVGFWPSWVPNNYKEFSHYFFDDTIINMDEFEKILNNIHCFEPKDINDFIYTAEKPERTISKLLCL